MADKVVRIHFHLSMDVRLEPEELARWEAAGPEERWVMAVDPFWDRSEHGSLSREVIKRVEEVHATERVNGCAPTFPLPRL